VTHEREMENRMRRLEADMKSLYRQIQIQDRQIQTLFHKVHQLEPEVERLVDVMRSRLRVIQEKEFELRVETLVSKLSVSREI
ncbi:MAG: hypothetical protein ABJQ14_10915, partial [Hyphomicrobiales bacterium]